MISSVTPVGEAGLSFSVDKGSSANDLHDFPCYRRDLVGH
jgi:hypothetical protein